MLTWQLYSVAQKYQFEGVIAVSPGGSIPSLRTRTSNFVAPRIMELGNRKSPDKSLEVMVSGTPSCFYSLVPGGCVLLRREAHKHHIKVSDSMCIPSPGDGSPSFKGFASKLVLFLYLQQFVTVLC